VGAVGVENIGGGEVHTTFWWGNPREDFGRSRFKCEDNIKVDLQEIR